MKEWLKYVSKLFTQQYDSQSAERQAELEAEAG